MCFNPSPVRRVPSPNRYMAVARFCFCKNNKRTIDRYRRICTVTVPFSLLPHPFSYKTPLISHSFTSSTHFLPRDDRPSRGRPDTSDMFPASIATTRLPESTPVCARASKMSRRWSGGMPDGRAEWQGLGFRV